MKRFVNPFKGNLLLGLGLGICPALAVSTTLENGVGLGLIAGAVLVISSAVIAAIKKAVPLQMGIPVSCVIIATVVACADMVCRVFTPALSANLGIYVPLLAVNCLVLGHAHTVALGSPLRQTLRSACVCAAGFFIELVILSALREILGSGTLGALPLTRGWTLLPLAALPAGGLLVFAGLVVLARLFSQRKAEQ